MAARQNNPYNWCSWKDGVVPLAVELIRLDRETIHLPVSDLSTERIAVRIQLRPDGQPFLRRRVPDQIDDDLTAHQRTAPPVYGNVAEHPMLDLVPLAGARRKVASRDPQADLVGQPLEFPFPQPASAPVGTAAVGCDEELRRIRVDPTPHLPPPSPQRLDSELGRVVIDPDTDPARVGRLVVDAVGDGFAQVLVFEIVDLHFLGTTLGPPLTATIAELAHKLFLLGIDRHHRLSQPLKRLDPPVDVLELGVPVGVIAPLDRLAVGLETVAEGMQKPVDRPLTGTIPLRPEFGRQLGRTLTGPPQGRHRVTTGARIDQILQGQEELRGVFGQGFATTPGLPNPPGDVRLVGESGVEFVQTRLNGDARQPGGFRDTGDPAPSDRSRLGGRPEPACSLIEDWLQSSVLLGDDVNVGIEHRINCNSIPHKMYRLFWRAA
jgi:hypothetical protein